MEYSFSSICFYLFSAILICAAVRVVTARNPVHAVLSLVLTFFTCSMIWLLMNAEFLSIALVLIYVGAVMVLFLFVVMMLNVDIDKLRDGFWRYLPVGLVVALVMVAEMTFVLNGRYFRGPELQGPALLDPAVSNTRELAKAIFTDYAYPFELASLVLLVAMIAAVMLTYRRRVGSKSVDPAVQVAVKASDRLVVHKLPPVKTENSSLQESSAK